MAHSKEELASHFAHVAEKVSEILKGPLDDYENWPEDRRWWLQLGFNLGRYSELSGEGKPVWDTWLAAIETGDREKLADLTAALRSTADKARSVD